MIRSNLGKTELIEISASMNDAVVEMMGGMLAEAANSLRVTLEKLRSTEDEADFLRAELTCLQRPSDLEYRGKMN